ncbi:zinc metalloprotease mde10, partial [Astrocystis sublimbata]
MRFSLASVVALLCLARDSASHSLRRNPLSYITRVDSPTLHTPSNRIHAHTSFDVSFTLHDGKDKVRIELEPNHDVLSDDATIQYTAPDGTVTYERIERHEHRVYRGHAFLRHPQHSEWLNAGYARIAVLRDGPHPLFEGAFKVNGNFHHIQLASTYRQTRYDEDPEAHYVDGDDDDDDYMIVWRDTDITSNPHGSELKRGLAENASVCSSDLLEFNNQLDHPVNLGLDVRDLASIDSTIFRRQDDISGDGGAGANLATTIGSSQGCPTSRKVALIGIATDCTYTKVFDSRSAVTKNLIGMVNTASALYEDTFNISLGIRNLTISDASCPGSPPEGSKWNQPCSDSVTINDRLDLFSEWRGQFNDNNAYWTLMSTCGTDAAVGLAWLGQLCSQGATPNGNDTTAGANVVVRTNTEWQVFAHETGHTFGAYHDCTDISCADGTRSKNQCCPLSTSSCNAGGKFIMNPSTDPGLTQFSPCSVGNICSAMMRKQRKLDGEDCDCGGESGCKSNSCCDPKTCKFTTRSVCDPANEDCCTDQCQFATNGTVCRTSTGSCDPRETCSGTSATCPVDLKAKDGTDCGADGAGLKCASGQCTSRDLQCQNMVGGLTMTTGYTACDGSTCLVRCKTANSSPGQCEGIQHNFLDGTCKGASTWDKIKDFFRNNKDIIIPVAAVVGGLI